MARLREFDSDKILAVVRDLFWQKGFEGTSYADLSAATGLGRGSLYAAYGDKHALYRKALSLYIREEVQAAVDVLSAPDQTGKARISAYLELVIDAAKTKDGPRGCFLCNAAIDMASGDPETGTLVRDAMNAMRDGLLLALEDTAVSDRAAAAEHLLSVYAGMRTMARCGLSVSQLVHAGTAALKTIA